MPLPKSILYLTDPEVKQTLTVAQAVELAEKGIKADGAHRVVGDKFYMDVGEAGFVKPFSGYIREEEFAFVKTFSYFHSNPDKYGCSTTSSMVLLFDAETGYPVCIMEGNWVTALKTGASTAVTAAYLANEESKILTIFGAGMLGRAHLEALLHRFQFETIFIIDKFFEASQAYVAEMRGKLDCQLEAVSLHDRQASVEASDIVITVTTGDMPLVERAWLKPGAFIARLGSYTEIALDVITGADKVVVDNWHYVHPRIPEIVRLVSEDRFGESDLHASWPDIVAGEALGRENEDEIIVYIALGIWGEYAAILPQVYREALAMGLGQPLQMNVHLVR